MPPRLTPRRARATYFGHAQLSLVEHALCPLDAAESLGGAYIHETEYSYSDVNRHRKKAHVRVTCPEGLSPADEFYLWGLLSLTFSQPNPSTDFFATPYYCLRQLGCIAARANRGGKNYGLFRASIRRLSAVTYRNDAFFDPIRGEHRDVAFGLLKYSLPIEPQSSRAWRFVWDQQFFEFCSAVRGSLLFDFQTYRTLDPASRRLYLLLRKIFWRYPVSPEFDVRALCVETLGFAHSQEVRHLKRKLWRCIEQLLAAEIIALPPGVTGPERAFTKRSWGVYAVSFHRGRHFDRSPADAMPSRPTDSPLYEPLQTIGLDHGTIRRVLAAYDARLVAEIADMTLAAGERFGDRFFKRSRQAYFMDNLQEQAKGHRTPPDWWRELRREEQRRRENDESPTRPSADARADHAFRRYLDAEVREAFDNVMDRVFADFRAAGQAEADARRNARHMTETHFRHRFYKAHPEWHMDGPVRWTQALP